MIVEVIGGARGASRRRGWSTSTTSTALHLALGEVTDEEAAEVLERAGLGRFHDSDTVFLDVAALRAAAEPRATAADWQTQWDAMIAKARSKGWLSEDGATLQVHVESAAGA